MILIEYNQPEGRERVKVFISMLLSLVFLQPDNTCIYEEPVAGMSTSLTVVEENPIEFHVVLYSAIYGVDSDLVKAVIDGESNGDIQAYNTNNNGTHDRGLMQINSCNFEWLSEELGVTDFYNPLQNIHCGVFMISDLMTRHTELHEVLMCYNMGEKRTRELKRKGIYSSEYSRKIMKSFNRLKNNKD